MTSPQNSKLKPLCYFCCLHGPDNSFGSRAEKKRETDQNVQLKLCPHDLKVEGFIVPWGPSWSPAYRFRGEIYNHLPTPSDYEKINKRAQEIQSHLKREAELLALIAEMEGVLKKALPYTEAGKHFGDIGALRNDIEKALAKSREVKK